MFKKQRFKSIFSEKAQSILSEKEVFQQYCTGKTISYISFDLGISTDTVRRYLNEYNCKNVTVNNSSKWEKIISEYLDELGIKYEQNTRKIISPLELDFYLPNHNIAIEINGNYWHSELGAGKNKNYHYDKFKLCQEKGITLFQYFEDELINSLGVIKAKIRYLVHKNNKVIGARKCIIKDISFKDESDFLNKYHIQGASKARSKCIGAYYNNELVAVFGWALRKPYLEITRFAVKFDASYPGLFSKMMKHMIKELNYKGEIVSFSNNGHSNGNVYKQSGFTNVKELGPAYWYTKDYLTRENRQKYMKNKIQKQFNLNPNYVKSHTEWQLMQELGYDRIWDSGKIKWLYFFD